MITDTTVKILSNGNLELSIDNDEAREDLADALESYGDMRALSDALESYSTNGEYCPFDAMAGNPFVGLTDAPCIAEAMDIDDSGVCTIIGRFWYFNNYSIECPVQTLIDTGRVEFTLGPQ